MKIFIEYDDKELTRAIKGLHIRDENLSFRYQKNKSESEIKGSGRKIWFHSERTKKWYLPEKWTLTRQTWGDYIKTQKEYSQNRISNYKNIAKGQSGAMRKKILSIFDKFNRP
jgi:hypothetical protein